MGWHVGRQLFIECNLFWPKQLIRVLEVLYLPWLGTVKGSSLQISLLDFQSKEPTWDRGFPAGPPTKALRVGVWFGFLPVWVFSPLLGLGRYLKQLWIAPFRAKVFDRGCWAPSGVLSWLSIPPSSQRVPQAAIPTTLLVWLWKSPCEVQPNLAPVPGIWTCWVCSASWPNWNDITVPWSISVFASSPPLFACVPSVTVILLSSFLFSSL